MRAAFIICVRESEKAVLDQVSTKGTPDHERRNEIEHHSGNTVRDSFNSKNLFTVAYIAQNSIVLWDMFYSDQFLTARVIIE